MSGTPTSRDMTAARDWLREAVMPEKGVFPISFIYNGAKSASVIKEWKAERKEEGGKVITTLTDPETGLECRCEMTVFDDYPVVEWVGYFRNTGSSDTPIIEDIRAIDSLVKSPAPSAPCYLIHARGSDVRDDDFAETNVMLYHGKTLDIASRGGRSSSETALPFFNLDAGGSGVMCAIGWTGGWNAEIWRRGDNSKVNFRAGMRKTHLKLHPGEEIRTPRIALLFWEGERIHGHNMLRQFILAHHTPRPNGELLKAPICPSGWGEKTYQFHIESASWWKKHNIPVDTYWIDAGWYGDAPYYEGKDESETPWPEQVGNWYPNKTTYPLGMRPIGDALKEMGMGFVLWLEPERVRKGTAIEREHPDWLLGPVGDDYLVDLGNPDARKGITDLLSSVIEEGRVTCYRQDANIDPSVFWSRVDEPERVGMHEIRHIEGLYAFWDELLERHPGLYIDNCSSGGRRIDLETTSRSIPLWRSDYQCFPYFTGTGMQGQTHGLSLWVPLSTGACTRRDTYSFRSAMGPGIIIPIVPLASKHAQELDSDWARKMVEDQIIVGPYFYGDFYPILSYNVCEDTWAAWQVHRPDLGEGAILAFRRSQCPIDSLDAQLKGLEPDAVYEITCRDDGSTRKFFGRELMDSGLTIEILEKPGSALLIYKKL